MLIKFSNYLHSLRAIIFVGTVRRLKRPQRKIGDVIFAGYVVLQNNPFYTERVAVRGSRGKYFNFIPSLVSLGFSVYKTLYIFDVLYVPYMHTYIMYISLI